MSVLQTPEDQDREAMNQDLVAPSGIDWQLGDTAQIKDNWEGARSWRTVLGPAIFYRQWWVPVIDPQDGEPTFIKEAAVERVRRANK